MDLLLLFGLLAMGATLYAMRFWDRRHAHPDWQRLPTRAEYLSTHPECTTDDEQGARCCACGSDKVLAPPPDRLIRQPLSPCRPGLRQGAVSYRKPPLNSPTPRSLFIDMARTGTHEEMSTTQLT